MCGYLTTGSCAVDRLLEVFKSVLCLIDCGSETLLELALVLSFRTSRASFLPPPFGGLSGSDRERFELAYEVV